MSNLEINPSAAVRELVSPSRPDTHLGALLDSMHDSIVALDDQWRCTYLNRAAEQTLRPTGIDRTEILGSNIWSLIPGLKDTRFHREYQRAMDEQIPVEFEEYFPPLDQWFEVRVYPTPEGVLGYARDVTARRKTEEELAERTRLLALSAAVGSSLTRTTRFDEMLQGCAQALVDHLDAAFARIWSLNADDQVLELLASAGLYTHLDGPHSRVPVGQFKIGLVASEKAPHLTNSVQTDPRVSDKEWARREGMVAFAGYPLIVENRLIGVMAAFARHPLSEATLSAMATVADQLAIGIERKQGEEALRRNEELLAFTLRSIGDGVITTDESGQVIFVNEVAEKLTGWTQADAFGRNAREVFHIVNEDTRQEVESPITRALRENTVVGLANHTVLIARDGAEHSIDDSGAPIRDAAGAVRGSVLVFRDVSGQRVAELALKQSTEQLRLALQAASMGTWEWDVPTNRITWSDNLEEIHGMPRGSFDGEFTSYLSRIHAEDQHIFTEAVGRALETAGDFYIEFRLAGTEESPRWISGQGRAYHDSDGRPIRMIGIGRDVTERRLAEEKLKANQAEIEGLNVRLHRAVYESSHRIKNQLQVLGAMVDMQLMDGREAIPAEEMQRLGSQIRTLAAIHDMFTMESRKDAEVADISSQGLLERVLSMLQSAARQHRIDYELEDVKLPVRAATPLVLILNELVSNSIKHGKSVCSVSFQGRESNAELTVEDDGPGFPADFNPATAANTGLDLVDAMAHTDLRGTVSYLNRPQGGARVCLTFPTGEN